jgi:tripartite-type tricarboxylate transporter receptor subunit TctC
VARSAPDGYTILFTVGAHNLFMIAFKDLPFHPIKDFTPITVVSDTGMGISAGASFPPNNLKEAIDYAKGNPGKVSYGHTGVGGISHLAMEQIRHLTGTDLQHVPFKGGGPLTVSLVGGQLQMGVLPLASVMNQVKAGKIKVLAVLDSKRFAGLPDVMSVNEAVPNFEMLEGSGCWAFGPAGMPAAIVNRLHAAIVKALAFPEVRAKIESGGQTPNGEPPAAAAAKAKTIAELGGRLAKLAGVEPE